jgi:TRAP-type C4-dicarboxylate transport system permease small subunit
MPGMSMKIRNEMWLTKSVSYLNTFARPIMTIVLSIGISILAMMMFLMATDVVLRYIFNSPLPGAYELIEYMMAILVPFGIVYCAHQKSHVSVDLVIGRFTKRTQAILGSITSLLSLSLFLLVAWQSLRYITENFESNLTSAVLLIPMYPFIAVVAVGFSVLCLVLLIDFLNFLSETVTE